MTGPRQRNNCPCRPKPHVGIGFGGSLDQLKQGGFLFLTVDDEGTIEYFMPAMFRIYLGKAKYLTVCKLSARSLAYSFQVFDLIRDSGPGLPGL